MDGRNGAGRFSANLDVKRHLVASNEFSHTEISPNCSLFMNTVTK